MVRLLFTYISLIFCALSFGQSFKVELIETSLRGNVYSPAYWNNQLVVCSDQKDRIYKTIKDANNFEPSDLYIINPNKKDSVKKFDIFFRTEFHDGPVSFSSDGNKVAISRNLMADQKIKKLNKFENKLGIYFTSLRNGNYKELESFVFNNEDYNVTHPYLNEEGNVLYFSSNMPGGEGGYDIYYSKNEAGIWKTPVNLGSNVNSSKDEVFPSIDKNSLYFSSNRNEIGGLDIYSFNLGKEVRAQVMDTSINTIYDEFGLITKNELQNGYFSSNRNGQDEIFKFEYDYPTFGPCDSIVKTYFCYTLEDEYAIDIENLEGLVYVWNVNGEKLIGVSVDYCFPEPGEYEITLDIEDTIVNQVFYEQTYIYLSIQLEEQPYIDCPDTVDVLEQFEFSAENTYLPNLTIDENDYFWLIDGTIRKRGKIVNHSFENEGQHEVQLGVIGFDGEMKVEDCTFKTIQCGKNLGTENGNINLLSDNPKNEHGAEIIKNEKRYSNPSDTLAFYTIEIANNTEEINNSDPRLKLIEGKYDYKLKYLEEEEVFIYYVGEFESIEEAHSFWEELRQLGLQDAIVRTIIEEEGEINLDDIFVLNNVKFDIGKWEIREDAGKDLNKVIEIMTDISEVFIVISAYTDNAGEEKYNLDLSNKRASEITSYLIKSGIDPNRIEQKGFGEKNPIASNETKQGRELNRRVEFIIKSE